MGGNLLRSARLLEDNEDDEGVGFPGDGVIVMIACPLFLSLFLR